MTSSRRRLLLRTALVAGLLGAHFTPVTSGHTPVSRVTWNQDIGPLLERRCTGCHRRGGFAPMSLQTYEDARKAADQIREEVQEGRMPPWPAARGFGDHVNDRSLTPLEIGLITAWTTGTTPLGPALPKVSPRPSPEPDLTLTAAGAAAAPGRWVVKTTESRERWIAAWRFRPASPHAQAAEVSVESGAHIGSWVPPDDLVAYPDGVGVRVPAGARLAVTVEHRRVADASEAPEGGGTIELFFADRPASELRRRTMSCGSTPIERAVDLVAIRLSAGGAGERVDATAVRADGSIELLGSIDRFRPGYRPMLRLRRRIDLPAGSRIEVTSSSAGCSADVELVERPIS